MSRYLARRCVVTSRTIRKFWLVKDRRARARIVDSVRSPVCEKKKSIETQELP